METITEKSKIFKALIDVQAELSNPPKDKEGHGYKYTELSTLLDLIKPVLHTHGLGIVQQTISSDTGTGYRVGVRTVLIHESGEKLESEYFLPLPEQKIMTATQQAGAAITYARRYALSALLNIASEEDTDAQKTGESRLPQGASKSEIQKGYAKTFKNSQNACDHMTVTTKVSKSEKNNGRTYEMCLDCGAFIKWLDNNEYDLTRDFINNS